VWAEAEITTTMPRGAALMKRIYGNRDGTVKATHRMGWYKIHRKIFANPLFANPDYLGAWIWLIGHAATEDGPDLKRGQLFASRRSLAKAWGWPPKKVRLFLEKLRAQDGARFGARFGAKLTICNYDEYQLDGAQTRAQTRARFGAPIVRRKKREDESLKRDSFVHVAFRLWNETAEKAKLPLVRDLSDKRQAKLGSRLADHGIDGWKTALAKVEASAFLRGSAGWTCTFDWLLEPRNFAKVIEGNYDRRGTDSANAADDLSWLN